MPTNASLPGCGRYGWDVLGFRLSQRGHRRGFGRQNSLDAGRPVARHPARRRGADRARRARGRRRLFLSRHHGRHQRAARGQGRQDRPVGHRRFPRHLRSGRAGAALRHRDLRRHVRQADAAGAAEPDRRGQGARRFPRQCAGAARRGRVARDIARAQSAKHRSARRVPVVFISSSRARSARRRNRE